MSIAVIFSREIRDTVLSKRFLIYLALIFMPVAIGAGFSYAVNQDPSMLAAMTSMLPQPITKVTPAISMMIYMDGASFAVVLIPIIHAADFVAGEESRGMLSLLASKPLPRWHIIFGKYSSFLVVFVPLVALSVGLMSLLIPLMGIGSVAGSLFLGYFIYLLAMGMVYASIATLFSSVSKRTLIAVLASFVLWIVWVMFDFMIIYLPEKIADVLNVFSLSYYASNILGYISGGVASLFVVGGVAKEVLFGDYLQAIVVIIALIIIPVAASMLILQRKDIRG